MSANLGFAPTLNIADIVGIAVLETVITSSSMPIFNVFNAIISDSVTLPTAAPNLILFFFKKFFSNTACFDPKKIYKDEPNPIKL